MATSQLSADSTIPALSARPTDDDYDPLPDGLSLTDAVVMLAHEVRAGDLVVAYFGDDHRGERSVEHVPGLYAADPHLLNVCPCEGCEECDEIETWTLADPSRTADREWRYVCLSPAENDEPCVIELSNRPVAVIHRSAAD